MRKEADFEVTDHIRVFIRGGEMIEALALRNAADIAGDTLAEELLTEAAPEGAYVKDWDINGENVVIGVVRI